MRHGFLRARLRAGYFRIGTNQLPPRLFVEFKPVPPGASGRVRAALHKGDVFPPHAVRADLLDEAVARWRVHRQAKDPAGVLIEPMHRQWPELTIARRQNSGPGISFTRL